MTVAVEAVIVKFHDGNWVTVNQQRPRADKPCGNMPPGTIPAPLSAD